MLNLFYWWRCHFGRRYLAPPLPSQGTAGHRVDPTKAFDRSLLAGARLTAVMRLAVEQELGFTVSAGIASNKVLAKLASSRNKPNKQVRDQ